MKVKGGRARAAVRAVILAGKRIHGVLAEITFLGRGLHRFARSLGERDLVVTNRHIHVKQNAASVLTDGLRFVFRQRDVLIHNLEGVLGEGILLLVLERREDGFVDVIGNLGRRATDQFDQGIQQFTHSAALA